MISIENVSFRYAGAETQNVSSLNLRVPKGECVLICGPSGSGKTTVARLIGGLIPRFFGGKLTGSLKLNGKDMRNMTVEEITSTVGSVFQDPRSQFFTTDTTSEMAFTCENMGVPRDEMLNRIALSSYVLDVSGLLERSIFDLSSGERHHVITLREFRGHVMMNPPDEKMEKAACALDRAMRFPHALRYREYYRKKTSSKGTRSS